MKTRYEQMTSGGIDGYSNFIGDDSEYQDWYGVIGQSRDSDALERSNFKCAVEMLGGESETVRIECYGHWACGWIEEVYVKPESEAYEIACKIRAALEDYPVLNEEDFCQLEHEEALEVWKNCYDEGERIRYIRENRDHFDFHDFLDLVSCVRGKYFCGYDSELLN